MKYLNKDYYSVDYRLLLYALICDMDHMKSLPTAIFTSAEVHIEVINVD